MFGCRNACGLVDRIGIINYHDVRDGGKLGSSRRGDLVKPVLSGSKELVAETKFYSNRGPILPHHKYLCCFQSAQAIGLSINEPLDIRAGNAHR